MWPFACCLEVDQRGPPALNISANIQRRNESGASQAPGGIDAPLYQSEGDVALRKSSNLPSPLAGMGGGTASSSLGLSKDFVKSGGSKDPGAAISESTSTAASWRSGMQTGSKSLTMTDVTSASLGFEAVREQQAEEAESPMTASPSMAMTATSSTNTAKRELRQRRGFDNISVITDLKAQRSGPRGSNRQATAVPVSSDRHAASTMADGGASSSNLGALKHGKVSGHDHGTAARSSVTPAASSGGLRTGQSSTSLSLTASQSSAMHSHSGRQSEGGGRHRQSSSGWASRVFNKVPSFKH
mmetsp:Transcript_10866/g.24962  ORF Transcript_10866/g.24962 Transcript_10866/m.24962 type:complete len:300 (+) Transcript_10866:99-998(+)